MAHGGRGGRGWRQVAAACVPGECILQRRPLLSAKSIFHLWASTIRATRRLANTRLASPASAPCLRRIFSP
eukprot:8848708-Alexandrium_andersonii.AAC.1